ncbi:hypothetical protein [Oscillatoria sp. CS-180]|nr:hypothetical protein [Oscillatoria sp. CS-180]
MDASIKSNKSSSEWTMRFRCDGVSWFWGLRDRDRPPHWTFSIQRSPE